MRPVVGVTIVRDDTPAPVWDDVDQEDLIIAPPVWQTAVLSKGMQSGKPSVMLRLSLPDGKTVISETSLAAWITATAMMRGAFPEAFAGTALAGPEDG